MQAKQEEKAELEAILEQVRHVLANGLLMALVPLLRYASGAADPLSNADFCFTNSSQALYCSRFFGALRKWLCLP